jgi:hypothetical protein
MASYRKVIAEGTFQHRFYESLGFPPASDEGGAPLVLRITLDDMELLDGFYMSLPLDAGSLSIEGAIRRYVLCENEEDRLKVKRKLSREPNPDLIDIYDALLYLYQQAETGKISLKYHINNGDSDIQPTDLVDQHQRFCTANGGYKLLDLVLEVSDNLDPFSGLTYDRKDAMLENFRCIFVLYIMDKLDYQPVESCLKPVLDYLSSEDIGLIHVEDEYFITPRGYDLLSSIVDEAEFYIDNYDIFGDVYMKGHSEIRFNTGYGDDLIVPVLMREGSDPHRAIFVAALYLGNMDYLASDLSALFSETPFRELFSLISYSPTVEDIGAELLDRVIREGRARIEEQQLRKARLEHIENIDRRING